MKLIIKVPKHVAIAAIADAIYYEYNISSRRKVINIIKEYLLEYGQSSIADHLGEYESVDEAEQIYNNYFEKLE